MLNCSSVKLTPPMDFFLKPYTFDLIVKAFCFYFPYYKCFIAANKLISELCYRQIALSFYTFVFFTLQRNGNFI